MTLNVDFQVPEWVAEGVKNGSLRLFGGVVRDNEGRIVHFLEEALKQSRKLGKADKRLWVFTAIVVAVAGGSYYLYRRYTKNGHALSEVEKLDAQIARYYERVQRRELTPADIDDLERACGELRGVLSEGLQLEVSAEDHARLRQFVDSVRDLALKLAASKRAPLALPEPSERASLRDILDAAAQALAAQKEFVAA